MGCLRSTYLGLLLGAPSKSIVVWEAIEEGIQKILTLWRRQYLSKGGRHSLIKSTLCSLSIYCMSLLVILRRISLRLAKVQRDFSQGGGALEKKLHLVTWAKL